MDRYNLKTGDEVAVRTETVGLCSEGSQVKISNRFLEIPEDRTVAIATVIYTVSICGCVHCRFVNKDGVIRHWYIPPELIIPLPKSTPKDFDEQYTCKPKSGDDLIKSIRKTCGD